MLLLVGCQTSRGGITFVILGSFHFLLLNILKLILFFFVCGMARVQEETSTSQAGRRKGTTREMPSASNLVIATFVGELRSFCQVPVNISLELSYGTTFSTVGGADNAIYFTREQFTAGLRFPISSLVKQFLHFTRAPPTLIHPNFFRF